MNALNPTTMTFWSTVGLAIICGAVVGVERQLRGKPAGIRTSILVCLGTAVFVQLGTGATDSSTDTTRILGQLITGVGFLGGGVMFSRDGTVNGVTTAAVIWVLAGIGAAIGFGLWWSAVTLAAVTVGILMGVEAIETRVGAITKGSHARDVTSMFSSRE